MTNIKTFFNNYRIKKTLSGRAKEIFTKNNEYVLETCLEETFYSSKKFESMDYPGKYYGLVLITSENVTDIRLVIDMYTGQPFKNTVTMEYYGFFQTCSNSYCELSYDEANKILKEKAFSFPHNCTEINESNWQNFIPESQWKNKKQWDEEHQIYKPDDPICVKKDDLIFDPKYSICNSFIDFHQRFGCSYCYLRKTNRGYRLFYANASNMAYHPFIDSISKPPTEEEILQLVSKSRKNCVFYDRLLNDIEISYYLHTLQMNIDNKALKNDLYGSALITASLNGNLYNVSSKFIWEMRSTMRNIAEKGIITK